jgi:hypothetical protein
LQGSLLDVAANIPNATMGLRRGEDFEIIGTVERIKIIAVGSGIREIARLRKAFGAGRWRKLKGIATVRFEDGTIQRVELHRYEAHGIGRRKLKIRRYLD